MTSLQKSDKSNKLEKPKKTEKKHKPEKTEKKEKKEKPEKPENTQDADKTKNQEDRPVETSIDLKYGFPLNIKCNFFKNIKYGKTNVLDDINKLRNVEKLFTGIDMDSFSLL